MNSSRMPLSRGCRLLRRRAASWAGCLFLVLGALGAAAEPTLSEARRLLQEGRHADAARVLRDLSALKPGDPWLTYDIAVAAYAARDYEQADTLWQDLAARMLPAALRDKVWFQIGNVSYRAGEQAETATPEEAVAKWEQSLEAYRIVLAARPRDTKTLHNRVVVEHKLARLHSTMAKQILQQNPKQPKVQQIEKMEAALDHQRAAERLAPESAEYKEDVKKTERQLSEAFTERAAQLEKRADAVVEKKQASTWERKNAQEQLEKALTDFHEAAQLDPQNAEAPRGEERVQEKLSKLLAQDARQLQREAREEKTWNPDKAIDKFEQALDKFEQALARNEKNDDARKGEEEVKKELEDLQMKRGDQKAEEGREDAPHQQAKAAEEMMDAVNHYQQAEQLNPDNTEAPRKIAELRRIMPPLLEALAKREREEAAKDEPKSPENAVSHLERAEASYEMIQDIKPEDGPSKEGQEQVRQDMARLRQQIAQKAAQQQKKEQQGKSKQEQEKEQKNFQNMLARVKRDDRQQQYEQDRRNPTQKYNPEASRTLKNW